MPEPSPRSVQIELEKVEAPPSTFPFAPVSPTSPQIHGLMLEANVATIRLLDVMELSGNVTSNTSASGAPLSAPNGMAVVFFTSLMMGLIFCPFSIICVGVKSADQLTGRRKRTTHERCVEAPEKPPLAAPIKTETVLS